MTRQPSLLSGYISALLRAIETSKNEPAAMRGLVYELARISLGKQILVRYEHEGAKLHQHLFELERAIKKVESLAQEDEQLLEPRLEVPLIVGPFGSIDQAAVAVSNSPDEATDNDVLEDNRNPVVVHEATADDELEDNKKLVIRQAPDDFYYEAHPLPTFLKSSRALESAQPIEWPPIRDWSNVQRTLLLLIVAVMSVAIFIGFVWRSDNSRPPRSEGAVQTLPSPKTQNEQTSRTQTSIRPDTGSISGMPDFELPTVFGVYAVNDGKLFQLDTLPIRVPDQRVAISAMISKPSPTTIPSGKIAFVVFRRDLVSSAPDKVLIRVVARVARELQFPGNGPATIVKIDDQWAVRSNAYEFAVAPLNDNPQMIVIHAARPDFSLPVGRYALVLKEQAFDFTVGGQITDAAQCLERTDAVGGAVYSECRQIP